jgi:hypothetical protein
MNKEIMLIALAAVVFLSACTQNKTLTSSPSPSSAPTNTPEATQISSPSASPSATATPMATKKSTINNGKTESKVDIKNNINGSVQSYSTSNSTTNINVNSNGTNVKVFSENGRRYAEVNGKRVELDANGCYDYDKDGTKIHTCVND